MTDPKSATTSMQAMLRRLDEALRMEPRIGPALAEAAEVLDLAEGLPGALRELAKLLRDAEQGLDEDVRRHYRSP